MYFVTERGGRHHATTAGTGAGATHSQAQQECRSGVDAVSDTRAQALFETLAEVLGGALKALDDYQNASERVWQRHSQSGQQNDPSEVGAQDTVLPHQTRPAPRGPQPPVVTDMAPDIDETHPPTRLFTE